MRESKIEELKNVSLTNNLPEKSKVQDCIRYYQTFVNTLHNLCIKNLYPGAINCRRKSSLSILCLMDEFLSKDLTTSLWNLIHYKVLFDCVLLDTYELNKNMAFLLIKSCKLTDKFFDTREKIIELVNVGVQLANNVRPLDCITAAYMLRISLLSSNVQNILAELTNLKETKCTKEVLVYYMITLLKLSLQVSIVMNFGLKIYLFILF